MNTPAALASLIERAVLEEKLSVALYRRAAELAEDESARRFLVALADEECLHATELGEALSRLPAATRDDLEDEHLALLDAWAHGSEEALSGRETIRDILLLALKRENRARAVYERLARLTDEPELEALFTRFAECEGAHYQRVREQFREELAD